MDRQRLKVGSGKTASTAENEPGGWLGAQRRKKDERRISHE
jgi:hypothetical protein